MSELTDSQVMDVFLERFGIGGFMKLNSLLESNEKLEKQNKLMKEALESICGGALRYYDDSYSDITWDVDDTGMPNDPEYYVYQELKKARQVLREIEK